MAGSCFGRREETQPGTLRESFQICPVDTATENVPMGQVTELLQVQATLANPYVSKKSLPDSQKSCIL